MILRTALCYYINSQKDIYPRPAACRITRALYAFFKKIFFYNLPVRHIIYYYIIYDNEMALPRVCAAVGSEV